MVIGTAAAFASNIETGRAITKIIIKQSSLLHIKFNVLSAFLEKKMPQHEAAALLANP
jgi:hypothetical protein